MNLRFIKTLIILFLIATIFFYPICSKADDLDKNIENIVKDFERKIGDVGTEKDYFIVVRSFFDKHTEKPSKLSGGHQKHPTRGFIACLQAGHSAQTLRRSV